MELQGYRNVRKDLLPSGISLSSVVVGLGADGFSLPVMTRNENTTSHHFGAAAGSSPSREADSILTEEVFVDLYRMASRLMKEERRDHMLDKASLVHEVYLRLAGEGLRKIKDRSHLLAVAARHMRSVLVDYARSRGARKRGGGCAHVPLSESGDIEAELETAVSRVREAILTLRKEHPRAAKVVDYKFFGGYTEPEIAILLRVSEVTVRRDWKVAKDWLALNLA